MRCKGPLLHDVDPDLLHFLQRPVLCTEGECLLRHDVLQQQPNMLHYKLDAILCIEGECLLRQDVLQQQPNLLHHMRDAVLRDQGQDLLRQHFMRIRRSMLQRQVLREGRILCQWTVSSIEVQSVEPAGLEGPLEPRRPASAPQACARPMKFEVLNRPLSIDSVRDGGAYVLAAAGLTQTNLFLQVGCVDELFIKLPSARGFGDYQRFIKLAESNPEDIRSIEEAERFERLELALQRYPGLKPLMALDAEITHYLAVHKIQHERLRNQTAVGIPRAIFGLLRTTRLAVFGKAKPALFQERVHGMSLWDMYDFDALRVKPQWHRFLPVISAQLSNLLDSSLLNHVDWNIQNFVFDESDERLYYVDLKPTTFVARQSNAHNLKGIRDYFIV